MEGSLACWLDTDEQMDKRNIGMIYIKTYSAGFGEEADIR